MIAKTLDEITAMPPATGVPPWVAALREAVNEVKSEQVAKMIAGLVVKASNGDMQAMKMVFDYLYGGSTGIAKLIAPKEGDELPAAPSSALPRSPEKIATMARRVKNREALHHPLDERGDDRYVAPGIPQRERRAMNR